MMTSGSVVAADAGPAIPIARAADTTATKIFVMIRSLVRGEMPHDGTVTQLLTGTKSSIAAHRKRRNRRKKFFFEHTSAARAVKAHCALWSIDAARRRLRRHVDKVAVVAIGAGAQLTLHGVKLAAERAGGFVQRGYLVRLSVDRQSQRAQLRGDRPTFQRDQLAQRLP